MCVEWKQCYRQDTSGHTGQTLTDKWILNGHEYYRTTRTDVNGRSRLKRTRADDTSYLTQWCAFKHTKIDRKKNDQYARGLTPPLCSVSWLHDS